MSAADFHLILNHLPVFGTLFACVVMICGCRMRNETVINVALVTLMCVGISAIPVAFTGMIAEDAVTDLLKKDRVSSHLLAGELAAYISAACGMMAYVAYASRAEKKRSAGRMLLLLFLLSLMAFVMMVWAGYTGGTITHG